MFNMFVLSFILMYLASTKCIKLFLLSANQNTFCTAFYHVTKIVRLTFEKRSQNSTGGIMATRFNKHLNTDRELQFQTKNQNPDIYFKNFKISVVKFLICIQSWPPFMDTELSVLMTAIFVQSRISVLEFRFFYLFFLLTSFWPGCVCELWCINFCFNIGVVVPTCLWKMP